MASSKSFVVKMNLCCYGCQKKIKKLLQDLDDVSLVHMDMDKGEVKLSGAADPKTVLKELRRAGKRAKLVEESELKNPDMQIVPLETKLQGQVMDDLNMVEQLQQLSAGIKGLKQVELTSSKTIKLTFIKDRPTTSKHKSLPSARDLEIDDQDHTYKTKIVMDDSKGTQTDHGVKKRSSSVRSRGNACNCAKCSKSCHFHNPNYGGGGYWQASPAFWRTPMEAAPPWTGYVSPSAPRWEPEYNNYGPTATPPVNFSSPGMYKYYY